MTLHHACGTNGAGEIDHVTGRDLTEAEIAIVNKNTSFGAPVRPTAQVLAPTQPSPAPVA